MAIDTRAKRMSATGMKPFHKAILPDGTIDASDRVHIAWLYSGISIADITAAAIALTLKGRGFALSLQDRQLTLSLGGRSLSLTLPWRK